jgi:hypothetical protein
MDSSFAYAENTRRKIKKFKAVKEGRQASELLEDLPPREVPGAVTPLKPRGKAPAAAQAPARRSVARPAVGAAQRIPGAGAARGTPRPAAASGSVRGRPAAAAGSGRNVKSAVRARPGSSLSKVHIPPSVAGLKANEERLLLESRELDLFGTGTARKVAICPDCQHEIVRVVCLGVAVRACLECKGVWFSYPNVREFSRDNEWFQNIGPAIQFEIDKRERSQ